MPWSPVVRLCHGAMCLRCVSDCMSRPQLRDLVLTMEPWALQCVGISMWQRREGNRSVGRERGGVLLLGLATGLDVDHTPRECVKPNEILLFYCFTAN